MGVKAAYYTGQIDCLFDGLSILTKKRPGLCITDRLCWVSNTEVSIPWSYHAKPNVSTDKYDVSYSSANHEIMTYEIRSKFWFSEIIFAFLKVPHNCGVIEIEEKYIFSEICDTEIVMFSS